MKTIVSIILPGLIIGSIILSPSCKKLEDDPICTAPSGITIKNITLNSVEFSWNAIEDAQQYLLEYRKTGTTTFTVVRVTSGINSKIENLASGTTYDYRLQSNCSGSNSNYSEIGTFKTLSAAEYYLPNKWRIKLLKENNIQSVLGSNDFVEFVQGGNLNQSLTVGGNPISLTGSWSLLTGDTVSISLNSTKKWKINNIDAGNLLLIKSPVDTIPGVDSMRMELF